MKNGRYLIVCADDSFMVREMLKDGFEGTDYVLELVSGVQNLEQRVLDDEAMLSQVDLFVFDFDMPEMTGTQIASILDESYEQLANVPFIIFSGRPRQEVLTAIDEARSYSFTFARNFKGYIEKQEGSIDTLLAKIGEVFASGPPSRR